MSIVQFYKDKSIKTCILHRCSQNVIEITFKENIDKEILLSGFDVLNENNSSIQGKYDNYSTIYQTYENDNLHFKLSNDGSVYIEPVIPEPEPEIPYEPTPEELEAQFQQNKNDKIMLSKSMLAEFLENNPIHSTAHGNIEGIYSVTNEKQTLMMSQYMTYQIEKTVNPDAKLTWNETGKSCEEWTEDEFLQLILEIKTYVYPLVSYQQHLEEDIGNCTSQEDLNAIVIDYYFINAENNTNQ